MIMAVSVTDSQSPSSSAGIILEICRQAVTGLNVVGTMVFLTRRWLQWVQKKDSSTTGVGPELGRGGEAQNPIGQMFPERREEGDRNRERQEIEL